MTKRKNEAVQAAHEQNNGVGPDGIMILSTGVKAKLVPVAASLIQTVQNKIKTPPVPMWRNEDKGRDEPNPNDPAYLQAKEEAQEARGVAVIDALIMFGVELVDGLPDNKMWIRKLKAIGIEVDEADEFDVEFAYKKYICVSSDDLMKITQMAGVTGAAVQDRVATFPD